MGKFRPAPAQSLWQVQVDLWRQIRLRKGNKIWCVPLNPQCLIFSLPPRITDPSLPCFAYASPILSPIPFNSLCSLTCSGRSLENFLMVNKLCITSKWNLKKKLKIANGGGCVGLKQWWGQNTKNPIDLWGFRPWMAVDLGHFVAPSALFIFKRANIED